MTGVTGEPGGPAELHVRQSRAGMARIIVLSVGMTAVSVGLLLVDSPRAAANHVIGVVGVVTFGAATAILVLRALRTAGDVVTLTAEGFHDRRVTRAVVPWTALTGAVTWTAMGQRVLVLQVAPEAWAGLDLTPTARRTRAANRALGADGLAVAASGLTVGHDALLAAAQAWVRATR